MANAKLNAVLWMLRSAAYPVGDVVPRFVSQKFYGQLGLWTACCTFPAHGSRHHDTDNTLREMCIDTFALSSWEQKPTSIMPDLHRRIRSDTARGHVVTRQKQRPVPITNPELFLRYYYACCACCRHRSPFTDRGYLGLQASRIGHVLWKEKRKALALAIQSRVSEVFGMDIHPGCVVGKGVMIDHATGVVFGETAVVGDDCTFLHGVTLGGTGKSRGDRHPKLGCGILVGAGSMILGNIKVGDGCKVRYMHKRSLW